jgi:outer membrane immunogenic protein
MKRISLAGAVLLSLASPALAADVPVKAPAPAMALLDWTGFYVGAQLGHGWGNDEWVNAGGAYRFAWTSSGVFGGLHAGYSRQFGALVAGLQAEINASGIRGSGIDAVVCGLPCNYTSEVRWFGSIDGRLGFASGRTLFYAIGGLAFAEIGHTFAVPGAVPLTAYSASYSGWNLGAGLEYLFAPNWTARVEYRYYDFGSAAFAAAAPVAAHSHNFTMHTVRAGVSWLFATR